MLSKCSVCEIPQESRYPVPKSPADLPSFHVREDYAFSCVDVDFAGPLYARLWNNVEKKMIKTYVALFTCATSRAVHLELVPNLEAETFLLCLRRFVRRRRLPRLMVSDNAKTFKSEKEHFKDYSTYKRLRTFLLTRV